MSGTTIPMGYVPPDIPGVIGKINANNISAAQVPQIQAQTQQTQAQAGLIGAQTQAADIQNQIASARLPFLMRAYSGGASQPGSTPGSGPPGAIGAGGGQQGDWTGPAGIIVPPGSQFSELGALPISKYNELILSDSNKWDEAAARMRVEKNAYVNQAVAATLDPQTGQADPDKWNQMVSDELQQGWMAASQARNLYGHPEMAQTLLNSTLPAGEQPGTVGQVAGAKARGAATGDLVEVTQPVLDANGKDTGQTQKVYVPKSQLLPNGQAAPGAASYGPPVQATELPTAAQALLRALSPSEANAPNQRYVPPGSNRPGTFNTSQGHPGEGAAGLFQFEPETWARGAQLAGIDPKNMSQANQERAAWAIAQDDYATRTGGKSLLYDLNHGNVASVNQNLKATWPSIYGGSQQNAVGATFPTRLGSLLRNPDAATGGAAPAGGGGGGPAAGTPATAGGVAAAGPPQITPLTEAQLKIQQPRIDADASAVEKEGDRVQQLQTGQGQLLNIRNLAGKIDAGALGDTRAALNNYFATFGPKWTNDLVTKLIPGIDPSKADSQQEFVKQTLQQAGNAERETLGSRGGFQAISLYQRAFPNINMQPTAIKDMSNLLLVAHQRDLDYSNGKIGQFNTQYQQTQANPTTTHYQPLSTYDTGVWGVNDEKSIHAPTVYVAAAALMNGHNPGDAFQGLTPQQQVEALHIITRVDPNAKNDILARGAGRSGPPAPAAAPAAAAQ